MGFAYQFGGLRLESDFLLPTLRAADSADGLVVVQLSWMVGTSPPSTGRLFGWGQRFGLSLCEAGADWLFAAEGRGSILVARDGRRVCCYADGPPSAPLLEALVRRVLPRVAILHGGVAFHAAAAARAGGCLLLTGLSGAGKSTLGAALERDHGWALLSDDASIIAPEQPAVWPAARGAYLLPDSLEGLSINDRIDSESASLAGKMWLPAARSDGARLPLAGLVFLNRVAKGEPPRLRPVDGFSALARATPQLIRFNPSDRKGCGALFRALGRALGQVAHFQLDYPADYQALPAVATELEGAFAWAEAA